MNENEQEETDRADVADLTEAIGLAERALGLLKTIELRHRQSIAGNGMSAMARARTDLSMAVLDERQIGSYLGILDQLGGAVA